MYEPQLQTVYEACMKRSAASCSLAERTRAASSTQRSTELRVISKTRTAAAELRARKCEPCQPRAMKTSMTRKTRMSNSAEKIFEWTNITATKVLATSRASAGRLCSREEITNVRGTAWRSGRHRQCTQCDCAAGGRGQRNKSAGAKAACTPCLAAARCGWSLPRRRRSPNFLSKEPSQVP